MDSSLNRPLAVVTGASSGIGYELAKQFAQNGFDLLVAESLKTKIEGAVSQLLPDTVTAELNRQLNKPGSANK